MHPSYILNPNASKADLAEVTSEFLAKSKTLMNMILLSCFDDDGKIVVPEELLIDSLGIAVEFVNDANKIYEEVRGSQ